MKLIINGAEYPIIGKTRLKDPVTARLVTIPNIADLGETLSFQSDDGFVLRDIAVSDFARWYIDGEYLVGTNAPEPIENAEPVEQEPTEVEQLRADVDFLLVMGGY